MPNSPPASSKPAENGTRSRKTTVGLPPIAGRRGASHSPTPRRGRGRVATGPSAQSLVKRWSPMRSSAKDETSAAASAVTKPATTDSKAAAAPTIAAAKGTAGLPSRREGDLPPPVLVYHSSARAIVFRDHIRRESMRGMPTFEIAAEARKTLDKQKEAAEDEDAMSDHSHHSEEHKCVVVSLAEKRAAAANASLLDMMESIDDLTEGDSDDDANSKKQQSTSKPDSNGPSNGVGDEDPDFHMATSDAVVEPCIVPLEQLPLGPSDQFEAFLHASPAPADDWTEAEREVVQLLQEQKVCVKTIKNTDWTAFLQRFKVPKQKEGGARTITTPHDDIPPVKGTLLYNSFLTSTSLLPSQGKKMKTFGSLQSYRVGAVFALPDYSDSDDPVGQEDADAKKTETWSWPSGYNAKTEFNVDGRTGRLMNGREEALLPLSVLRKYNNDYLNAHEYIVGTHRVSNLSVVPYNEVFLRVGGVGRLVNGSSTVVVPAIVTETPSPPVGTPLFVLKQQLSTLTDPGQERSFAHGVGLPIALFCRNTTFADVLALFRVRARLVHHFGSAGGRQMDGVPLLLITPQLGVRVLSASLQREFWKLVANQLNPFQNASLERKTTVFHTEKVAFAQKGEELIDLGTDAAIAQMLTPTERAKIAGGFGATDESVATILQQALAQDLSTESHSLQDAVNAGLAHAVRANDYHTARQLLILYSVVASSVPPETAAAPALPPADLSFEEDQPRRGIRRNNSFSKSGRAVGGAKRTNREDLERSLTIFQEQQQQLTEPQARPHTFQLPPPPPLDTDRLRSATNSDGLLAVLGAAQALKSMTTGAAQVRVHECIDAVEEWIEQGRHSMAFRLSSWYDQRAAQGNLQIASTKSSQMTAFVSQKAITNRKRFAKQLRQAELLVTTSAEFLLCIHEMLSNMHAPCLRLELLQYVLGLDNRYSVEHMKRSVELAATCLGMSATTTTAATARTNRPKVV